jgi:fructose-1,6-bisphosphatase/inositol monophosphatase family enzyme
MAIGLDVEEMVGECLREAARRFVLPFADPALRPAATEKTPGEVVTSVDLSAEAYLAAELPRIVPGIRVIGEEQASAETGILNGVETDSYWLVDALDGTANFSAGSDDYAMLVALVQIGETIVSWIYRPADDVLFTARLGGGARRNGKSLTIGQQKKPVHELSGDVLTRFLPEDLKVRLHVNLMSVAAVGSGTKCIGVDYPAVIEGRKDFVVYWRTLPWDHSPGVLLVQEAGGVALRPDRSAYRPSRTQQGLIIATSAEVADAALTQLFNL